MEIVLSFLLGALGSWAISHFYYRRSVRDADDALIASRIDDCTDGDNAFLVALSQESSIPRYSLINVEFKRTDGSTSVYASNAGTMYRSIQHRIGNCLRISHDISIPENQKTVSLNSRGIQCASFIRRKQITQC